MGVASSNFKDLRGWSGSGRSVEPPAAPQPAWPAECNITHLQFDSAVAYAKYARRNSQCLQDFQQCLITNNQGTGAKCDYACTVDGNSMLNECVISSDTPCTVSGNDLQPLDDKFPPYSVTYDLCLPRNMAPGGGCWEAQVPALTQYWSFSLCNAAGLYEQPDCRVSVSCNFNHSMPWDLTPVIWGTLGAAVFLAGLGFWYVKYRRPQLEAMGLLGGDYEGMGPEDEEEERERNRAEEAIGEPTPLAVAGHGAAAPGRPLPAGPSAGRGADPAEDDPASGHSEFLIK